MYEHIMNIYQSTKFNLGTIASSMHFKTIYIGFSSNSILKRSRTTGIITTQLFYFSFLPIL